jgi:hypothetical protein
MRGSDRLFRQSDRTLKNEPKPKSVRVQDRTLEAGVYDSKYSNISAMIARAGGRPLGTRGSGFARPHSRRKLGRTRPLSSVVLAQRPCQSPLRRRDLRGRSPKGIRRHLSRSSLLRGGRDPWSVTRPKLFAVSLPCSSVALLLPPHRHSTTSSAGHRRSAAGAIVTSGGPEVVI